MEKGPTYEELKERVEALEAECIRNKWTDQAPREIETRYRTIVENTREGIILQEASGRILIWNKAAEEVFGVSGEEAFSHTSVSRDWNTIHEDGSPFPGSDHPSLHTLSTGIPCKDVVMGIRRASRGVTWISINTTPLFREHESNPYAVVITFSDITERKRAEDAVRESEALLLETQAIAHLGSWELDLVANRLTWSDEVYRIFGVPAEELAPSYEAFLEAVHPEDRAAVNAAYTDSLGEEKGIYEIEHRVVSKVTGEVRHVHEKCTHIRDASGKIIRSVGMVHDITERKRAEEEIRRSEDQFRAAFENAPVGMAIIDTQRKFIKVNSQLCRFLGYSADELEGRSFNDFTHPDDRAGGRERWKQLLSGKEPFNRAEKRYIHKDGRTVWTIVSNSLIFSKESEPLYFVSHLMDITDRKQAEADKAKLQDQLNQAQKMETVGRLAGGVAHDLNNLLSPILGYGEMLQEDISPHDERRDAVDQILQAAIRARDVIRQLLSFSRKQTMVVKLAGLNQVVEGFEKLLRRTIREDIEIRTLLTSGLPSVRVDVGQIEQVIMNLAINAQDAMPAGGVLTIRTESTVLDERFCAHHPGSKPGTYAMLSVSDTGFGMDEETAQHVFEPFFSTKGEHGTGLGLASVYGIVKQHDGYIWVKTEPGKGTTFKVYLPATEEPGQADEAFGEKTAGTHGTETVLIAEDNDQIRILGHDLLTRLGYAVLVAENGREALEVLEKQEGRVHLLLTDVVMPDMNGRDLFERASQKYPTLKVLYMSGYSGTVLSQRGVLEDGVQIIQKPFSVRDLSARVREVLDKE